MVNNFDINGNLLSTFTDLHQSSGSNFPDTISEFKNIIGAAVMHSIGKLGREEATSGGTFGTEDFPKDDPLFNTRQEDLGYPDNPFGELYTYEPLLQNPNEWWQFSIGEIKYNKESLGNSLALTTPNWIKTEHLDYITGR